MLRAPVLLKCCIINRKLTCCTIFTHCTKFSHCTLFTYCSIFSHCTIFTQCTIFTRCTVFTPCTMFIPCTLLLYACVFSSVDESRGFCGSVVLNVFSLFNLSIIFCDHNGGYEEGKENRRTRQNGESRQTRQSRKEEHDGTRHVNI